MSETSELPLQLHTMREATKILRYSRSGLLQFMRDGRLKAFRASPRGAIRFSNLELARFVRENEGEVTCRGSARPRARGGERRSTSDPGGEAQG